MVYVVDVNGNPLMPTSRHGMVKHLLKEKKAIIIKYEPFTIKLQYETSHYLQDCTLGVDVGSGTIGTSVVRLGSPNLDIVIYAANTILRNDIKKKLEARRELRRTRRNMHTRYRKARFLNRKNSIKKGRFSPTLRSKIDSHIHEIELVKSILPITKIIFEIGHFDMAAMDNPELRSNPSGYQHGKAFGFKNIKAYVLDRDKHTCQLCKEKGGTLHVHHIVQRSNGGSNQPSNLITLCRNCHIKVHNKGIKLKTKGHKTRLAGATQMNVISSQLQKIYPESEITYGYITKSNRKDLLLPKDHFIDASVIASQGKPIKFEVNNYYIKKCVAKGSYVISKHTTKYRHNPIDRSLPYIPIETGKNKFGFRCGDLVKYKGKKYIIGGKHAKVYALLDDLKGNRVLDKEAKVHFKFLKKLKSKSSLSVGEIPIKNILENNLIHP